MPHSFKGFRPWTVGRFAFGPVLKSLMVSGSIWWSDNLRGSEKGEKDPQHTALPTQGHTSEDPDHPTWSFSASSHHLPIVTLTGNWDFGAQSTSKLHHPMLKTSYIMTEYIHRTCSHSFTYFKSALDFSKYVLEIAFKSFDTTLWRKLREQA